MVPQSEVQSLIHGIIIDVMPDDEFLFEAEGTNIIADIYRGKSVHSTEGPEFNAFDPHIAKMAAEFVPLISGTVATISTVISIVKALQPKSKSELSELITKRWLDDLIAAGVSRKKAQLIVERHAHDVANVISKH